MIIVAKFRAFAILEKNHFGGRLPQMMWARQMHNCCNDANCKHQHWMWDILGSGHALLQLPLLFRLRNSSL